MHISRSLPVIAVSITASLGLLSFVACMVAGGSRQKTKDLKLNGKLCYLPGNRRAVRYGIVSVSCLSGVQILGNLLILQIAFSRGLVRGKWWSRREKKTWAARCFLVLSWLSFGLAILMMSGATSMSRKQPYGRGWLDGECFLVKDWVYVGSGGLILVTTVFNIGSASLMLRTTPNQQTAH